MPIQLYSCMDELTSEVLLEIRIQFELSMIELCLTEQKFVPLFSHRTPTQPNERKNKKLLLPLLSLSNWSLHPKAYN